MKPFNWTCPHCETPTVMTTERIWDGEAFTWLSSAASADGNMVAKTRFFVCPNPKCLKTSLQVSLWTGTVIGGEMKANNVVQGWRLVPWGNAKSFPDFVPPAIREDYSEACSIKDLSPKAAATLARRAVQGIIRNYWGIKKARLIDEIKALEAMVGTNGVTQETVDNIDAVREVGNIGAHMEKDVDLIIDVEPEEADLLIQLVESLIEETYVERNRRQERSKALLQLKGEKLAQKKPAPSAPTTSGEGSAERTSGGGAKGSSAIPIPPTLKP